MRSTFGGTLPIKAALAAMVSLLAACGPDSGLGSVAGGTAPFLLRPANAEVTQVLAATSYSDTILADSPSFFWKLNDAPGSSSVAEGISGSNRGALVGGAALGAPGALPRSGDTALQLNGSTAYVTTGAQIHAPSIFSLELWLKADTRRGGLLLGFGSAQTGPSPGIDRALYMLDNGKIAFGIRSSSGLKTISSDASYNDQRWHHVVASLSAAGLSLSVDGLPVAADPSVTSAPGSVGYWRMGYDRLSGLENSPSSDFFAGSLGEVAIYSGKALSPTQIQSHFFADQ